VARGRALKGTARGVIVARRFWREGGKLGPATPALSVFDTQAFSGWFDGR
jgi:hypothetical protein